MTFAGKKIILEAAVPAVGRWLPDKRAEAKEKNMRIRRAAKEDMGGLQNLLRQVLEVHHTGRPDLFKGGCQKYTEEELAELLQAQLVKKADPDNTRQIKPNDSYYLLKKSSVPIVIAECGFLSNREEAEKLCSEAYQEKIAWAICVGILQHLNMR